MVGIIYKFTILARYKMDGHKPFYVGQHWESKNIEFFISSNEYNYEGSGKVWNNFLDKLKKDYPKNWRKLVKREVLYVHRCSQKTLDVMEAYYIKKCKSHYSYKQGGCNIRWGGNGSLLDESTKRKLSELNLGKKLSCETRKKMSESRLGRKLSDNTKKLLSIAKMGDLNPAKRIEVRIKLSNANKGKPSWNKGKKMSKETRMKLSVSHIGKAIWNKGIKMSDEQRRKLSEAHRGKKLSESHRLSILKYVSNNPPMLGKHHTEETKRKLSEINVGNTPGNKGKICINNGTRNMYIDRSDTLPKGWQYGKYKQ